MKPLDLPKESQEALLNGANMFIVPIDTTEEFINKLKNDKYSVENYLKFVFSPYQIDDEVYLQEEFINQMGRIVYSDTREFSSSGEELIETSSEMEEYQSRWKGVIKNVKVVRVQDLTYIEHSKILAHCIDIQHNTVPLLENFQYLYNKQYHNYEDNPYVFLYEIERN
jgi:hypothetical protein